MADSGMRRVGIQVSEDIAIEEWLLHLDEPVGSEHRAASLAQIRPLIRRVVSSVWNAWGRRGHLHTLDDLENEVFQRFLESPPALVGRDEPIRALYSWVRTVAHRCMVDAYRRSAREGPESQEDAGSGPYQEVAVRQEIALAKAILDREYPLGRRIFDLMLEDPNMSGEEMARRSGCSSANVFKIRQRMRDILSERLNRKRGGRK